MAQGGIQEIVTYTNRSKTLPNPKKKIALLTDWFAPGYKAGGPIQSCVNFCIAMKMEYDIYVVTTDTDLSETTPYGGVRSDEWTEYLPGVQTYYFSKSKLSYKNLLSVLRECQPDYLYLNHIFSFHFVIQPLLMNWFKQIASQVVLSPRGALFDGALHHKTAYLKKQIFLKLTRVLGIFRKVRFHATNEIERGIIQNYFPNCPIVVANNFANQSQTNYISLAKEPGLIKLIFAARILPIKNLLFALQCLKYVRGQVRLTIVGPLEDSEYWRTCEKEINELPSNCQTMYLGPLHNTELISTLREHHLFFLPTQSENFGHSIFEAFLAGRPVLISDQTPWRDLAGRKIGWDIPLSKPTNFALAIETAINWTQEEFDEYAYLAWNFAKEFNSQSKEMDNYKKLFS